MTLPPGDEVLGIAGGHLTVEQVDTVALAREFGTPLYVVSERQLRLNASSWRAAATAAWQHGEARVLPSLKANTSPVLRRVLSEEGLGCDVFGAGELEIALRSGVPADAISLNGATKPDATLERAIVAGVRITLDSHDELVRAQAIARARSLVARVRFRLRPWLPETEARSDFDPTGGAASAAIQSYRAGMPDQELELCLPAAIAAPELEPLGLMAHATRQTVDLAFWRDYAQAFGRRAAELAAANAPWRPRELDLGGGFALPRDPTGRHLPHRSGAGLAPTPETYARVLAEGLEQGLREGGLDPAGIALELEPGRAVYGNAGIHLARVLHVKRQARPVPATWIETDTSEAFLADTVFEANGWTVVLASDPERRPLVQAALTGISCGFDQLVPPGELPDARPGEVVAILDTGAYQDATASNFNAMPRPATVLVSGDRARLIKRRETLDDVVARELDGAAR